MPSRLLLRLAEKYWRVRRAQERDHTDEALNFQRSEAHDMLLRQMRAEGLEFEDREDAAQQAQGWLNGHTTTVTTTGNHNTEAKPEQSTSGNGCDTRERDA